MVLFEHNIPLCETLKDSPELYLKYCTFGLDELFAIISMAAFVALVGFLVFKIGVRK